ncbi:MAG: DUF3429 domain-containing protein [Arenicellales bacterium]
MQTQQDIASTRMNRLVLIKSLTLAGALPFMVACAFKLGWFSFAGVDADNWLWTYALVISAFMAGSHWGIAIKSGDRLALLASNGFALAIFGVAVWLRTPLGIGLLILLFAAQLLVDRRLLALSLIAPVYWRLRLRVTSIVCFMLAAYLMIAIGLA